MTVLPPPPHEMENEAATAIVYRSGAPACGMVWRLPQLLEAGS